MNKPFNNLHTLTYEHVRNDEANSSGHWTLFHIMHWTTVKGSSFSVNLKIDLLCTCIWTLKRISLKTSMLAQTHNVTCFNYV